MTSESSLTSNEIAARCAEAVYDAMVSLEPNGNFLPGRVVCDYAGMQNFKALLATTVRDVLEKQPRETPEIPLNVLRYKVIKDAKDEYCLKACPDGDLTDWSNYEALLYRAKLSETTRASFPPPQVESPAGVSALVHEHIDELVWKCECGAADCPYCAPKASENQNGR